MKKTINMFAGAGITGVLVAGMAVSQAYAWHPVGTINKSVEDVTTNSSLEDANDAGSALAVNNGDTLKYVIKISNNGTPESNGDNDMGSTVLTDTLPTGVALTSDPSQTQISVNIGTIKAGASVTETYEVKVTSTTDGDVITNKACFTGNSLANDNPQNGCDTAVIKVSVPATPTPTPTPTPTTPVTPAPTQPTVLPNTGAGNVIDLGAATVVLGYAAYLLNLKRRVAQR